MTTRRIRGRRNQRRRGPLGHDSGVGQRRHGLWDVGRHSRRKDGTRQLCRMPQQSRVRQCLGSVSGRGHQHPHAAALLEEMLQLLAELLLVLLDLLLPQLALPLLLHHQGLAVVQVVEHVRGEVLGSAAVGQESQDLLSALTEAIAEPGGVVGAHSA